MIKPVQQMVRILYFAIFILIPCGFVLSETDTTNDREDRTIPQIFRSVMGGDAGEVIAYSKAGGDINMMWKFHDESPLIVFAPDLTMTESNPGE